MNITTYGAEWFYTYVWDAMAGATTDWQPGTRTYVQRRLDYFNGIHAILEDDATYANGQAHATRVTNWIKQVILRHVGCMSPFMVTANSVAGETGEVVQSGNIESYQEIQNAQRIQRIDGILKRDVLLCGYAVEFHGFGDSTEITYYSPAEWSFLYDSEGNLACAVRAITLAQNAIYQGEVLTEATTIMYVYTDEERATFRKTSGNWEGEPTPEPLNKIPLVVWTADDEMRGIISEELITMNDEYNTAFNGQGDDIRNTVDSLLKIWGIDSAWLKANEALVRDMRTMPFDAAKETQDAEFLQRVLDIEPHTRHIALVRDMIHAMGNIPDVQKIIGATGTASGIAIKLMFTPQQQAFDMYAPFLEENIISRIDLLNVRNAILNKPQIEDYSVQLQFKMPSNRIEEWQNIKLLDGVVSKQTQLKLLSDIVDPDAELEALRRGGNLDAVTVETRLNEQAAAQAKLEGLLVDAQEATTSNIAAAMDVVREAMVKNATTA
jgi:SPP1 family phage portal protein